MTIFWIILGVLAVFVTAIFLLRLNAIRASFHRTRQLDEMIEPAIKAVQENSPSVLEVVANLASAPATRNHLFCRLQEMGRCDLFPAEYQTLESIAESDLVRWLMHPNELAAAPAQVQHVRTIAVEQEEKSGSFLLFKFFCEPPHWAAERGWMAGVAGPYWEGEEFTDGGSNTFSELTPFEEMTEAQHIEFLQNALKNNILISRTGV